MDVSLMRELGKQAAYLLPSGDEAADKAIRAAKVKRKRKSRKLKKNRNKADADDRKNKTS